MMFPKHFTVIALTGLLFAVLACDRTYAGVIYGMPGLSERSVTVSNSTPVDIEVERVEADPQPDSMNVSTSSGVSLNLVLAINELHDFDRDESSEPMVPSLDLDSPEPLPMELLKVPIGN